MWWRALVPSWRLFDRPVLPPELHVRAPGGAWTIVGAAPRRWWSWAIAPAGNLQLAYQASVDQLVAEVDELDPSLDHDAPEITGLASYRRVVAIARLHAGRGAFQWKIVVHRDAEPSDYLVSPELAA